MPTPLAIAVDLNVLILYLMYLSYSIVNMDVCVQPYEVCIRLYGSGRLHALLTVMQSRSTKAVPHGGQVIA